MNTLASSTVQIRQSQRALFRALRAERPAVILVLSGTKLVRHSGGSVRIEPGTLGVLPARIPLTIENRPVAAGRYVAHALLPDPGLIERMRLEGLSDGDPFRTASDDRARVAFDRAVTAIDDPLMATSLRENAVREVILWLAEAGVGFGPSKPFSFADRLHAILSAELDKAWRASEAARSLAVSEATLRRRLAAEGTTFRDLLIDVRMTHSLGLLQTTDIPINAIGAAVGYASPSRFAARFHARFGILPSAIRGRRSERTRAANARNGT